MLNIAHCQRNVNLNYNEISPHTSQNGHYLKKKKITTNKCWRGCGGKGTLLQCWWKCKLIQPLFKTVWRFLKNIGIKPPYDPKIPRLGIYREKTITEKDTCTPRFIAALFTIARMWTDAETEAPILWPPHVKSQLI